jgi:hypothetical protein
MRKPTIPQMTMTPIATIPITEAFCLLDPPIGLLKR